MKMFLWGGYITLYGGHDSNVAGDRWSDRYEAEDADVSIVHA